MGREGIDGGSFKDMMAGVAATVTVVTALSALGATVVRGDTGTNVGDLWIVSRI